MLHKILLQLGEAPVDVKAMINSKMHEAEVLTGKTEETTTGTRKPQ